MPLGCVWTATISVDCTVPMALMMSGTSWRVAIAAVTDTGGGEALAVGVRPVSCRTPNMTTTRTKRPAIITKRRCERSLWKNDINLLAKTSPPATKKFHHRPSNSADRERFPKNPISVWIRTSDAGEAAWHSVKRLDSGLGNEHHLAGLHTGFAILRDDVWLNHDDHSGAERLVGHVRAWAALRAEDRRQITATIAVQQIVDDGEACVLDHTCGLDHVLRHGAVLEHRGDCIECSVGGSVQVAVEGSRLGAKRKAAQHLTGMIPERRADFRKYDVACRSPAAGGKLRRHAKIRVGHRGHADEVNDGCAAQRNVGALHKIAEFALAQARLQPIA